MNQVNKTPGPDRGVTATDLPRGHAGAKDLSLEGMRGIACLSVFSCHFLYIAFPYLARVRTMDQKWFATPKWSWESWFSVPPFTLLYNGDFAVAVFFVLSGYVLLRKFYKNGDRRQLLAGAIKRYPRLMFPAAASIGLALALMLLGWIHAGDVPDGSIAGWIKSEYTQVPSIRVAVHAAFIGVPFVGDPSALAWNGPLWTIRIEFLGSIALFAVYFLFGKWKWLAIAAFVVLSFASGLPLYFLPFIVGAALNGATQWLKRHSAIATTLFAVGLALGGYDYTAKFQWMRAVVPAGYDSRAFWFAIGGVFAVAGVIGSAPLAKFFGSKVSAYFGRISFSLYLLHWPIVFSFSIWAIGLFMKCGLDYLDACWLSYGSSFALLVLLSEFFYRIVDVRSTRFADWLARMITGNDLVARWSWRLKGLVSG